jgi:hypothetical protein
LNLEKLHKTLFALDVVFCIGLFAAVIWAFFIKGDTVMTLIFGIGLLLNIGLTITRPSKRILDRVVKKSLSNKA